ncbi:hypothetical protein [Pseudanabaena sp. FACHB-2040]|uniref:hypothetical protein n=1 Tax=Pseudanabaena sp. FACHB-2040 TaxID=2692859 RepID=UPI00168A059B|nr:hypothetical protein [Pseudanabaena sp. FACHB-2040]MBD2256497.1 hypothetical protein [Pseudanabaena sp. FACHB-2040]
MKNVRWLVMAVAAALVAPSLHVAPAQAQMDGSYVGVPLDSAIAPRAGAGLVDSSNPAATILQSVLQPGSQPVQGDTGLQYQGRMDLPDSNLSVRGSVYVNGESSAVLPTLSYDMSVRQGTNVYAGAGVALVNGSTPIGDRNGLVLNAGAETEVASGLVLFGDAKMGVNTDSARGNSPMRLQVGVGRRW